MMEGDELLAQLSHDAWTHPTTGEVFPAAGAGATVLMNALQETFGVNLQDQSIVALDGFFYHQRGQLSFSDYLTMWRMVYDEAHTHSGLVINDIGKS